MMDVDGYSELELLIWKSRSSAMLVWLPLKIPRMFGYSFSPWTQQRLWKILEFWLIFNYNWTSSWIIRPVDSSWNCIWLWRSGPGIEKPKRYEDEKFTHIIYFIEKIRSCNHVSYRNLWHYGQIQLWLLTDCTSTK